MSARSQKALEEIFNVRSKAEHVHNPLDLFSGGTEEERAQCLFRRTRQADMLARFAYRTALLSDELLSVFKTDRTTTDFWDKEERERRRAWGEQIDLDNIQ